MFQYAWFGGQAGGRQQRPELKSKAIQHNTKLWPHSLTFGAITPLNYPGKLWEDRTEEGWWVNEEDKGGLRGSPFSFLKLIKVKSYPNSVKKLY